MKFLLDRIFGMGSTLKRETVIFCWAWLTFMIVRIFWFAPPEFVRNYENLASGLFWPIIVLLGAIFGIQLAPLMGAGKSEETTRVSTPTQTIETTVTKGPATDPEQPAGPRMPEPK